MKRIFITLSLVLSTIPMFAYYDFYDPNKTYYIRTGLTTTEGWVTFWFLIVLFILILLSSGVGYMLYKQNTINYNLNKINENIMNINKKDNNEISGAIDKQKFFKYYVTNYEDTFNYLNNIFYNAIYTDIQMIKNETALNYWKSNFDKKMKEEIEYFEKYYKMINKEIPDNIKNIKFEDIKNI